MSVKSQAEKTELFHQQSGKGCQLGTFAKTQFAARLFFPTPSGLNPQKLPTGLCLFPYFGLLSLALFHLIYSSTMVQPGPSVVRLKTSLT